MLNCIKKYRNDENRTVLTIKMHDCICLNKLGDLNTARRAKNEACEDEDASCSKEKRGKGEQKEQDTRAFKEKENITCLDNEYKNENNCDCGCQASFKTPCGKMDLKGGINCEKTIRILLCDAICVGMVALGVMGMTKAIWCKLK